MCATAATVWFILERIIAATANKHPRAEPIVNESELWCDRLGSVHALRELRWVSFIVIGIMAFGWRWELFVTAVSLALRCWLIVLFAEGVLNACYAGCLGRRLSDGLRRESSVRRWLSGRPVPNLDDDWEGFSVLSATGLSTGWREVVGLLFPLLVVAGWLMTGIAVVRSNECAAHYRYGRLRAEVLQPGLHFILPRPFSSVTFVPVNQIRTQTVGFEADPREIARQPFSWTRPHGRAEFPMIVGNGTELVSLNGLLQFRVPNEPDSIRRYVTSSRHPERMLSALAHQVLTEETRDATLDTLLAGDREKWNQRLTRCLAEKVDQFDLGFEVLTLSLVSVHPPIEVAGAYLDVVSARIDAEKVIVETRAATNSELLRCETVRRTDIAASRALHADRWAEVNDEVYEMEALCEVDAKAPGVIRRRAYCEVLANELQRRPITVIDTRIPPGTQLWADSPK